ncbi:MAG: 30S ribosomal protein S12 methylthiotransferase RimO [Eubacteriales bacterium]
MSSNKKQIHVYIVSLGCSKNLVDAECMTRILLDDQMEMVPDPSDADVIVVNTCGFIESAKKEAIDTILEMTDFKSPQGNCDFLVVTGCLAQRYAEDIRNSIPEVDQILGTSHYQDIARAIRILYGEYSGPVENFVSEPGSLSHMRTDRVVSTNTYAWLKIAEGCSNRCAYCAIPFIRGPYISRSMEDIVKEAVYLSDSGSSEIILTAQDTTRYGMDIYGKRMLPELIRELSKLPQIRLIRIMYTYSDGITDELVAEIKNNPKVAHYIDMPVQHGDDSVLHSMKRHDTAAMITDSLARLRKEIPDIILRTTVLVGFPGETKEAFDNLLKQISIWRFDRLGCFEFSPEEGTEAFDMKGRVRKDISAKRYRQVMALQQGISESKNQGRMQAVTDVTIETISDDGIFYVGRSYGEAPEVDPSIYVAATSEPLEIGRTYPIRIVDCSAYDLTGVTES